jgi:hypothetical protein
MLGMNRINTLVVHANRKLTILVRLPAWKSPDRRSGSPSADFRISHRLVSFVYYCPGNQVPDRISFLPGNLIGQYE